MEQRLRVVALESGEAELRQCGLLLRPPGQLRLCKLALGDVGVRAVRADQPSGLIADHRGATEDPAHAPIGPDDAVVDVTGPGAGEELPAPPPHRVTVVGMDCLDVVLEPRAFAPVVAEEQPPIRFGVDDLSADQVLLPAPGLAQLLRLDQQPFGLAQHLLGTGALGHVLVHNDRASDGALGLGAVFQCAQRHPLVRADGTPLHARNDHPTRGGVTEQDVSRSIEHEHAHGEGVQDLSQQLLAGSDFVRGAHAVEQDGAGRQGRRARRQPAIVL